MKYELIKLIKKHNYKDKGLHIKVEIEKYVSKLQENATILFINENGIKAFAAFYCNEPTKNTAFLSLILVDEKTQGIGYGSFLLNNSIELLQRKGFKSYNLEVLKTNQKAIDFYKKFNFKVVQENELFFIMEKKL